MKLLTAGGLLFSAVSAVTTTDTNDSQGMEGTYELFDYVLTVNAGEAAADSSLLGIGYNPVATSIIVTNDGGKIIVGYGMQTEMIALGFAIAYMTQNSSKSCTSTTSVISGYNTLVLKNLARDTATTANQAISTALDCATTTTWVYLADSNAATCMGAACLGISQPFFGIAEDWTSADESGAVYYIVGAIEFAVSDAAATVVQAAAKYGNGAYEVQIIKTTASGALTWQIGDGSTTSTIRSNCIIEATIVGNGAACERSIAHSAFLTARSADMTGSNATPVSVNHLFVGGIGFTPQSPLMYKNGWQFTIGSPLLYRFIILGNNKDVVTDFSLADTPIPSTSDHAQTLAYSPGAYTHLVMQLQADKTDITASPTVWAVKPGFEHSASDIFVASTTNWTDGAGATAVIYNSIMPVTDFGTIISCHGFKILGGDVLNVEQITQLMCVGSKEGAGYIQAVDLSADALQRPDEATAVAAGSTAGTNFIAVSMDKLVIPSGGIINFKGVATTPTYVDVECTSIAPHYATSATSTVEIDGWVFQCINGIRTCSRQVNEAWHATLPITALATSTISDECYADQRYLNYRVQTFYYGTTLVTTGSASFSWSRQDSYYEATATAYTNSGSPGVVLDSSLSQELVTNQKTYVFPMYNSLDGIQINHFGTSGTNIDPITYKTLGTGSNIPTASPSSWSSTDQCMSSNLLLEGVYDISSLAAAVTAYSDGYKATSVLYLESFMGGQQGAWKGYCMVYYSAQYTMDVNNGSICHVAVQSSDNIYGVASQYLMHVPANTWTPPAATGSVQPSALELTDAKYSVTYDPTSSTDDIFYAGHYISVWWYQPKYASSYTLVARYGKGDYVGVYCMYGTGQTSYFTPPASGEALTGAVALIAGAVVLGSTSLVL